VAVSPAHMFASSLMLTPRCARGQPFGCPNSFPTNSSTTLPPLQNPMCGYPPQRAAHDTCALPWLTTGNSRMLGFARMEPGLNSTCVFLTMGGAPGVGLTDSFRTDG
jgi:hypothetical protein